MEVPNNNIEFLIKCNCSKRSIRGTYATSVNIVQINSCIVAKFLLTETMGILFGSIKTNQPPEVQRKTMIYALQRQMYLISLRATIIKSTLSTYYQVCRSAHFLYKNIHHVKQICMVRKQFNLISYKKSISWVAKCRICK